MLGTVASSKVLEIKGASGQSASFFEVLANAGNTLFRVNATGYGMTPLGFISGGTTMPTNARSAFYTAGASSIGVVVQGAASQTADLQQWQMSDTSTRTAIGPNGNLRVRQPTLIGASLDVGTFTASNIGVIVRGAASQSANLQEWQNSAGSVLARIGSDGTLTTPLFVTPNANVRIEEGNSGGLIRLVRLTSAPSVPGTNIGRLYFKAGTTGLALFAMGPTGTEVRIADNIT
jgi:hypothetical protein